jgi:long-chain-fatty-acid--CoA ligase ACSBG
MGYFKDDAATKSTIDEEGFLHSGDLGRLDKKGNLIITGRLKELIITAGGENIAPVLIENDIKRNMKFISNCMVIGDKRKYLTVLLTLK